MLIDKTMVQNGRQVTSPITGKYLNTLANPDEDGVYHPVFNTVHSNIANVMGEDDVKFEDNLIYDGGGVGGI